MTELIAGGVAVVFIVGVMCLVHWAHKREQRRLARFLADAKAKAPVVAQGPVVAVKAIYNPDAVRRVKVRANAADWAMDDEPMADPGDCAGDLSKAAEDCSADCSADCASADCASAPSDCSSSSYSSSDCSSGSSCGGGGSSCGGGGSF